MIKIIWDWNGTLLDDVELCLGCINHLLDKNQLPVLNGLEAYRNVFGFPIRSYYERCGFDFSKTPWEELAADYMQEYMSKSSGCTLTPGALDALSKAKTYGFDNIILSASRLDYLKEQIAWFPLETVIDAVYGIDDIFAHSKLDLSRNFLKTCLPADRLYWIGDSLHDAENAAEIGARCLLVETGHQSRSRLLEAGVPVKKTVLEAVGYILEHNPPMPFSLQAALSKPDGTSHAHGDANPPARPFVQQGLRAEHEAIGPKQKNAPALRESIRRPGKEEKCGS